MFQFRRFPRYTYVFSIPSQEMNPAGLPHSETHGSKPICGSPWLFAAYRVLHRLPVPRHSPCALLSLTFMCSSSFLSSKIIVFSYPNYNFLKHTQLFKTVAVYAPLLSFFFVQFSRCDSPAPLRFHKVRILKTGLPVSNICTLLVEMNGIEPMTPCLQSRCSPS